MMITTSIAPKIALNRVKMLPRTIWDTVRVGAAGTSLIWPRATRSATSAAVRPRSGSEADRSASSGSARVSSSGIGPSLAGYAGMHDEPRMDPPCSHA